MPPHQNTPSQPPDQSTRTQLQTILVLFLVLRLTILFLFTPQGLLNAYTDYSHYFRTAQLSERGFLPFINMWYEYPPLSTYLVQVTYAITSSVIPPGGLDSPGYQIWARMFGALMLVFDAGVLILLHEITRKSWGKEKADWVGWVYALLSVPLFFWNTAHGVIMVFFTLLAIERFLSKRYISSAVALGFGIAAKLTPLFLLAPATRFLWEQRPRDLKPILLYGAVAVLVFSAFYIPFLALGGGPWVAASFTAIGNVGSWSTVWAMLDGNWGPGDYGPLTTRLDIAQASVRLANPPVIPELLKTAIFALLFGWLLLKPIRNRSPKNFVWFATITAMIFHIWSKGWSPQWVTLIIPFLLISFPNPRGLRAVLWLTLFTFVEWPISNALNSRTLHVIAILSRTLILGLAAFWAARKLWISPEPLLETAGANPTEPAQDTTYQP